MIKPDSSVTEEINAAFPPYKERTPDITGIAPFRIYARKDTAVGYTEALYELYSRNIKMNALHVVGLGGTGFPEWRVYYPGKDTVVCVQEGFGAVYTAVFATLRY
jgi:hypothetical protein